MLSLYICHDIIRIRNIPNIKGTMNLFYFVKIPKKSFFVFT